MAVKMVSIPGTGKKGHPDMVRAWVTFARYCLNHGKPVPPVIQVYGFAEASADTHADGMAIDIGTTDPWYSTAWRIVTGGPMWPRLWKDNYHTHGVLPHARSAAYQVRAWRLGRDGLGWQGMAGRDPIAYKPRKGTTFEQAIRPYEHDLLVDGVLGPATVKALQRFLNTRSGKLVVDGKLGPATWRALGNYLAANGRMEAARVGEVQAVVRGFQTWQGAWVDGVFGRATVKTLQRWLNAIV